MRNNPETLAQAMDYAAAMESCAAYLAVNRPTLREPQTAANLIRPLILAATDNGKQECFMAILLDVKSKVIGIPRECTRGLLDTTPVHPREVFREAVRDGAASVILAHNHPSGDPTPSKEDVDITRRLIDAGKLIGIRVTDHIVIGRPSEYTSGYVSLREKGLATFE